MNRKDIPGNRKDPLEQFSRLLKIMDELRSDCPWDRKQTLESLRKLTIEETYELGDAILQNDLDEIKKELGDLMLHIVFYAKIGSENKAFDMSGVLDGISNKLVYRHPHIYGDVEVSSAEEVADNWEQLKLKEGRKGVLSGVPVSLPALVKANRIQEKVKGVGFDWEEKEQVWDKVNEEFGELREAIEELKSENSTERVQHVEEEFGDLFFSLINAARLYDIDPENALERTNRKFIKRFRYMEEQVADSGRSMRDLSLEQMDKIWQEAKKFDD